MHITRLQFVSVPVADHARARDFYVNTLGFEPVFDHTGPGGQFVMVAPDGAESGLVLVNFGDPDAGPIHFQLTTDDLDADVTSLRWAGLEPADPRDGPGAGRRSSAIPMATRSRCCNRPGSPSER